MPVSAEDWKSTEMIRAENALHEAIEQAEQAVAEADELMAAQDERERSGEEVDGAEALREYANRPDAPEALRRAVHDVQFGLRTRGDALADPMITEDPVVMAALELVTRPAAMPRGGTSRVGYDPDDFSTFDIMRNE
jgi:hypothetical protein